MNIIQTIKILNLMGFVYFIKECGFKSVKIGKSETREGIDQRLKDLQVGNPRLLRLFGFIESRNFDGLERRIQKVWSSLNIRGEWFKFSSTQTLDILNAYGGFEVNGVDYKNSSIGMTDECREACRRKVNGQEHLSIRQLSRKYQVKKWRIDSLIKTYRAEFLKEQNGCYENLAG